MCTIHCFSVARALFVLTSKNTHIILSASHFCPVSLILLLSLPSSVFFKTIASLSLSVSHPSYSWPACLPSSFWHLSHSSLSFNHGYFLNFSVLLSLSTHFPCRPFPSPSHPVSVLHPIHNILLPFPLPTALFTICNLSHFLASIIHLSVTLYPPWY